MTLPFFIYTPQSPDARSLAHTHTHMHLQIHNIILLLVGGIASSLPVFGIFDAMQSYFWDPHNFDVFYRVYGRHSEQVLASNCAILWILILILFFLHNFCVPESCAKRRHGRPQICHGRCLCMCVWMTALMFILILYFRKRFVFRFVRHQSNHLPGRNLFNKLPLNLLRNYDHVVPLCQCVTVCVCGDVLDDARNGDACSDEARTWRWTLKLIFSSRFDQMI